MQRAFLKFPIGVVMGCLKSTVQSRAFIFGGYKEALKAKEMLINEVLKEQARRDTLFNEVLNKKDKRFEEVLKGKDKRLEEVLKEKDTSEKRLEEMLKVKDKMLEDMDELATAWHDLYVQEEKAKIRAESQYSAVLADRSVLQVSVMAYRSKNQIAKLSSTDGCQRIVDDYILLPNCTPTPTARTLSPAAKKALTDLQSLDPSFQLVSDANLAREMAAAYRNLSARIHFPDCGTLSAGIYVGSGHLGSKAMIAVFACIAQQQQLYDETVLLLNGKNDHSCTISNGKFLPC